jgi:hypothetical protein
MFEGTLIAESLRPGTTLDAVPLTVRRITRAVPGTTTSDQPPTWTLISFEITDADADPLANALAASLAEPGWYTDFRSLTQTYVVFPARVFRYPRGDEAGRSQAVAYGRTLAIPEPQLDWPV